MVIVDVPGVVAMGFVLKLTVTPVDGFTVALKATVELKPYKPVIAIVAVPLLPTGTVSALGIGVMVNVGGGLTGMETGVAQTLGFAARQAVSATVVGALFEVGAV